MNLPFQLLKVGKAFLAKSPTEWPADEDYCTIVQFVRNLRVVNDVAENAVQMATDYKELITKDVTQRKMLMVIGGRCSSKAKQVGPASNSVAANPEQVASQSEQSRYKSEEKLIYLQKMS